MNKSLDPRSGLDPKDYRYINPNPDPDFSPERNKAIVDETIREVEQFNKTWNKALNEEGQKRREMMAYYARYTIGLGKTKSIKDYIGKKAYEALIGEKIMSKIRVAQTTNRLNGNTRFKKGILL